MAGDRTILRSDQVRRFINTTAYWEAHATIIPNKGDIYIYEDAPVTDASGNTVSTMRVKVGTGREYLGQLPFLEQITIDRLEAHIADLTRHVSAEEKAKWDSKLNIDPNPNVHYNDGTIIFNRD